VIANDADFASLLLFVEAEDPEAGKADKCGGGTFVY
jgi:hypothetical protein